MIVLYIERWLKAPAQDEEATDGAKLALRKAVSLAHCWQTCSALHVRS